MHNRPASQGAAVNLRAGVVASLIVMLSALALLWALPPKHSFAASSAGGVAHMLTNPLFPDGPFGWSRTVKVITLVPAAPGTLYCIWDDTFGPWNRVRGPIVAPEGKRTLHVRLVGAADTQVRETSFPIRVDYDASPPKPRELQTTGLAQAKPFDRQGVVVRVTVNPRAGARVIRLGGADRYETAAIVSAHNFPSAGTAILATGHDFADALSASGLAGCVEGPVLLTRPGELPQVTRGELVRLGVREVIIVGGVGAVSESVAEEIREMGIDVRRIGGKDRYETSTMIAAEVLRLHAGSPGIFVAQGDLFVDAVSLAPLAYASETPIILVRPHSVPPVVSTFLTRNRFVFGLVAGGHGAVDENTFQRLKLMVPGLERAWGATRYDTAVAVASWGVTQGMVNYSMIGLATGQVFPDALTGGVAAGANRGVVLLSSPGQIHNSTLMAMSGVVRDTREIQIFGGVGALSQDVFDSVVAMTR